MKPTVDVVFTAHRPQDTQPLDVFFAHELVYTRHLDITVGYVSEKSLSYLLHLAQGNPDLTIRLTCGMHAKEGMTPKQLRCALELHEYLHTHDRGGVFVIPKLRYHGKIYVFHRIDGSDPTVYVGSGNLSAIVPGYRDTFEAGLALNPPPEDLLAHLSRDVAPLCVAIDEAEIPLIKDHQSPMNEVEDAAPVSTAYVAAVMSSPAQYIFNFPLKATPASNLNAHLGGGGTRAQKTGSKLARSWFEGELIIDKKLREVEGYPTKGVPFNVITDDGWTFQCMVTGDGGKNLRSCRKLSTFGTWMKSRFIEAGALELGETATQDNIDAFGRSTLTMKYHPNFDLWSFDLGTLQPLQ